MGVPEASLEQTEAGLAPRQPGWFVLNVADVVWERNDKVGQWTKFEGKWGEFEHYGIGIHVLQPGQPNGIYHSEALQESFLVLSGECLLLIEEEERRLRAWDFVHCPAGTRHIFVGAGEAPCAILMVGASWLGATAWRPPKKQTCLVRRIATGRGSSFPSAEAGRSEKPVKYR
jgi:uncharacterized cupin superfamily protein